MSYLRGGAAPVAGGRFGQAVRLDGVDDHVHVPFGESLAVGAGDFTAMAWIKYGASTANQAIFWGYGLNEQPQFWLRAEPADNRVRGWLTTPNGTASVSSPQAYDDNAWHHVAVQRAAGQLRLWVDGVVVATASAPTGSVSPSRPFRMYLGQRLDGMHRFGGLLDEARVYTRALTAAEIEAIRSTNAADAPNAVLRLPFG